MINLVTFIIAVISAISYFILAQGNIVLIALLLLTILTRFRDRTKNFGKLVEILFIFYLISTIINGLGISYPESLIIVVTILIGLIFLEGPEWSKLYFTTGETKTYFKFSLILAIGSLLLFGSWIYFNISTIQNPVPVHWPFDTLIIIGIGFAIYLSIVEEIIFRSFIYERAKSATAANIAILIQAALFGLMYYSFGIPDKIAGVILGSFLGMALGYLVYKTNSIYLAILVHFIVTLGIFLELTILG